jgi:hypothetical protein
MDMTRPQQIELFFNKHKSGTYNVKIITKYIHEKYFKNSDKTMLQLQNEICSNISQLVKTKDVNFKRLETSPYTYKYQKIANDDVINSYLLKYYNITQDKEIYEND